MEHASSARFILVTLCLSVVVTILALIGINSTTLGEKLGTTKLLSGKSYADGFSEGFRAAREKLSVSCPTAASEVTLTLSGKIIAINGMKITIQQTSIVSDQTVQTVADERIIVLTDKTKIERTSAKPIEEYQKDMEAFGTLLSQNPGASPPAPVKTETISANSLKVGDTITISSATDVRTAPEIQAVSVQVQ